ncbi:hypothetical protein ACFSZS_25955 [Seohaeicola zhoushanensis]
MRRLPRQRPLAVVGREAGEGRHRAAVEPAQFRQFGQQQRRRHRPDPGRRPEPAGLLRAGGTARDLGGDQGIEAGDLRLQPPDHGLQRETHDVGHRLGPADLFGLPHPDQLAAAHHQFAQVGRGLGRGTGLRVEGLAVAPEQHGIGPVRLGADAQDAGQVPRRLRGEPHRRGPGIGQRRAQGAVVPPGRLEDGDRPSAASRSAKPA